MNRTLKSDEYLLMLEKQVRFTRARARSTLTRERLIAHGHAVLACWDATSLSTHEAATCGPRILHTQRPL